MPRKQAAKAAKKRAPAPKRDRTTRDELRARNASLSARIAELDARNANQKQMIDQMIGEAARKANHDTVAAKASTMLFSGADLDLLGHEAHRTAKVAHQLGNVLILLPDPTFKDCWMLHAQPAAR